MLVKELRKKHKDHVEKQEKQKKKELKKEEERLEEIDNFYKMLDRSDDFYDLLQDFLHFLLKHTGTIRLIHRFNWSVHRGNGTAEEQN